MTPYDFPGLAGIQMQALLWRSILQALARLQATPGAAPPADGEGTWIVPGSRDTPALAGGARVSAHGPSDFDRLIENAAQRYRLDPALVKAVIQAESNFNPQAVSSAGASGLMQLMPGTATSLGVKDSFDPDQNVDGGARLLRDLLDRYDQNVSLALAAYNAGPGAVDKYGGIPPYGETQRYVPRILGLYRAYRGDS